MKIFSLQSITSFVVWGLVLGVVLAFAAWFVNQSVLSFNECKGSTCTAMFDHNLVMKGWPFSESSEFARFPYQPYPVYKQSIPATLRSEYTLENVIFWIVLTFIILGSVKYTKNSKLKN